MGVALRLRSSAQLGGEHWEVSQWVRLPGKGHKERVLVRDCARALTEVLARPRTPGGPCGARLMYQIFLLNFEPRELFFGAVRLPGALVSNRPTRVPGPFELLAGGKVNVPTSYL